MKPEYMRHRRLKGYNYNGRLSSIYSANTNRLPNVVSMLGQRRRPWSSIQTVMATCLVFAGYDI